MLPLCRLVLAGWAALAVARAGMSAGALVVVNSESPDYADFRRTIEPYFVQFGLPYEVRDIAHRRLGEGLDAYALLIVGHRGLDMPRRFLTAADEQALLAAVEQGTGLVSVDGALVVWRGKQPQPLYEFVEEIFGFRYRPAAEASEVRIEGRHFITALSSVPRVVTFKRPVLIPGMEAGERTKVLARAGESPLVATAGRGRGRAVLFTTYEWSKPDVKGKMYGLDDLVWRSLVWAARKPFVLRGMPRYLALRVDDVSGFGIGENAHLGWMETAIRRGLKLWVGVFIDDMKDDSEALGRLSKFTREGSATASVHARRWHNFFYLDEPLKTDDAGRNVAGAPWPDEIMAANWREGEEFFARHGIAKSKVVLPHFYQFAPNNFDGLVKWGAEFVGTALDPGKGYGTPVPPSAPYLLGEPPRVSSGKDPLYIADWLKVPGRPEFDRHFFNLVVEVRDVAGYEWAPSHVPVAEAIRRGVEETKREFDSLVPAMLFTHESDHIQHIPPGDWDRILEGVLKGLEPYRPIPVTLDFQCAYARALHTSRTVSADSGAAGHAVTVTLEGESALPLKFTVYEDENGSPVGREVEVGPFRGSKTVRWEP